jgi:hypothetical protein
MASIIFPTRSTLLWCHFISNCLVNQTLGTGIRNRWQNGHQLEKTQNIQAFLHDGYLLCLLHTHNRIFTKSNNLILQF